MGSLPDELDHRVRCELQTGESLVWTGQPLPRRFLRQSIPILLFGIFWTAFSVFWMAGASGMLFGAAGGAGGLGGLDVFFSCFPLFGVPFVLIGLGMLASPFWMYRRARLTCYALTDRRAIVWAAGWLGSTEVRSFKAPDLEKMARRDYADGSGDLIFQEFVTVTRDSDSDLRSVRTERGFLAIENVREVEELVRRTLLSAR
jgi:hypothetical protein